MLYYNRATRTGSKSSANCGRPETVSLGRGGKLCTQLLRQVASNTK